MEAGVGGYTTQQAMDLAHTEIRIQLTILRKVLTDEKCIIYVDVAVIYTNIQRLELKIYLGIGMKHVH